MSKNTTLNAERGQFSYPIILNQNEAVSTPIIYRTLNCNVGDKHPELYHRHSFLCPRYLQTKPNN